MNSPEIQTLIQLLSKLPGLGPRSGRRMALHLLKKREHVLSPLIQALQTAHERIQTCETCHTLDVVTPCTLCCDPTREQHQLCIVADVSDLWALERAKIFRGQYHVLGGVLSAVDGVGPQQLTIPTLLKRLENAPITEVILALNATIDGQTTIHYLQELMADFPIQLSTLAHGVPIGGELDYLDDGTLYTAFQRRISQKS